MQATSESNEPGGPVYSIVVPTLNEADNIDPLLEALFANTREQSEMEVIVVDDASGDGTAERARRWARTHPVSVIERTGPPDLSASVLEGAEAARGEFVVVMDADGSHPASAIPGLVAPLRSGSADIAIGSRHVPGARTVGWPWHRHLTSRVATLLAWPFTDVTDPMAGFFATRRERLLALPGHAAGYKILLELLVQGGDEVRTVEVPICFEDRQRGQSKLGLGQQMTYLKRLTYLAGGRVSSSSAGKFILVGLSGMLIDLLIFYILIASGTRLGSAHIGGFAVATVTNFALNYRWTFRGDAHTSLRVPARYLRFLGVALMALLMRGGVLVLLTETFRIPAEVAIIPAIFVTAGVNYLGAAFYVFSSTASGVIGRVRWHLAAIGLFAYVLVLRLLYLGEVPLIPDEMYYWVFAQNPSLSYLDHPPLVAWLIGAGTALFGDVVWGVRAMLVPLTLAGAWFYYRYGATMDGRTTGLMMVLAAATLPFFAASATLMTPDAPMLVAWAAALYFFKRALIDDRPGAFFGLGVAMGFGLLAKYTIALLAPAALVFMLIDPRARRWFLRPEPYLSVLLATLIFLPVLIWNWQNEWASFLFQGTRRLFENPDFASYLIVVYAIALLSPVIGLAGFYVFGPIRHEVGPEARKRRFMLTMTAVPLIIFAVYGLFTVIKFHWTVPAWIAVLPMAMKAVTDSVWSPDRVRGRFHRGLMRAWRPSILVLVLAYGILLHYLTLGLPGARMSDFETGYLGWPETARAVHEIEQRIETETGQRPIVAATTKWGVAAALAFHTPDGRFDNLTSQNLIGMSGSMWEFWFDRETDPDTPVLLVNYSSELIDREWLELALVDLGPLQSRVIERDGEPIRTLYYRVAGGFRPQQVRYPDRIPD